MHTRHLNNGHLLVEVRCNSCKVRDNRVSEVVCLHKLAHVIGSAGMEDTY
jgi:hypothetical protein